MTIGHGVESLLRARKAIDARGPALLAPGRIAATIGDVVAQVEYVQQRLAQWDIGPGDLVAGFAAGRAEMAMADLAFPCAVTFAPLHSGWHEDAYAALLARLDPRAVVVPAGAPHALAAAAVERGVALLGLDPEPDAAAGMFTLNLLAASRGEQPPARPLDGLAYVLVTSGTTGRPKLVPITQARVAQRVHTMRRWLQYSPGDVGCHLVPLHLGHGVRSSLLDPVLSGGAVACMPEGDPAGLLDGVERFGVNCVSAGFAVYRALLGRRDEAAPRLAGTGLRFARAGSGRLEPHEIAALETLLDAPLLVGYSSTETCTIAHDPLSHTRRPGSVGLPVDCDLRIARVEGAPADGPGEIQVRGPLVFDGYFDDPALTARSFDDGWFRTGDLGTIDADGYVFVTGRLKEQINRGGEKISPREIDRVLEGIAGVREAATFGMPHPTLGEEVVSAVALHPGISLDEPALMEAARRGLDPTRVPRRIHVVPALPRTESGKLARQALAALVSAPASERAPGRTSGDAALEADIAELWRAFVRKDPLSVHDDFFLAGGDSLSGARLLARVATRFGVTLPLRMLFGEAATVAGMARTIEAHSALRTSLTAPPAFTITRRRPRDEGRSANASRGDPDGPPADDASSAQ